MSFKCLSARSSEQTNIAAHYVDPYIDKNKTPLGESVDVIYDAMEKQRKTQVVQKTLELIQDLCSMC